MEMVAMQRLGGTERGEIMRRRTGRTPPIALMFQAEGSFHRVVKKKKFAKSVFRGVQGAND